MCCILKVDVDDAAEKDGDDDDASKNPCSRESEKANGTCFLLTCCLNDDEEGAVEHGDADGNAAAGEEDEITTSGNGKTSGGLTTE